MHLRFSFPFVLITVIAYLFSLAANEWIFAHSEFIRGVNWIYLPAGMRLLCILLFGGWGAVGLLIASWVATFYYYYPEPGDFVLAFGNGILSAAAPYLIYRLSQQWFGLKASLANLTAHRLLVCVAAYAIASPFLHHLWWFSLGRTVGINSFFVMVIGDLAGGLIIVYLMKGLLTIISRRR